MYILPHDVIANVLNALIRTEACRPQVFCVLIQIVCMCMPLVMLSVATVAMLVHLFPYKEESPQYNYTYVAVKRISRLHTRRAHF